MTGTLWARGRGGGGEVEETEWGGEVEERVVAMDLYGALCCRLVW